MPLSPQDFVRKWRGVDVTERAAAQTHFNDLCRMLDVPAPLDPGVNHESYAFERGATKTAGVTGEGQGWADVWKRHAFAWEYKGPGKDLKRAYDQLLQYREALENPPLLVVSDMQTIVVHTNITNTVKQIHTWTLDDLLVPDRRDALRRVWTEPMALRPSATPAQVTAEAARQFAQLADILRKYGEAPDRAAHFLIRILFCLFADDVGLLPDRLFEKLVNARFARARQFTDQLRALFAAMRDGGAFGFVAVPHFNGGLFDDEDVIDLDSDALDILRAVSTLDWSSVEPSILGTLFERSLDPAKRAQLGAHYTSREDIELIVEPVLMAPLRRRWDAVRAEAGALLARRAEANQPQQQRHTAALQTLLMGFSHEIARVRVLDPACGSGNFLYVALKALLDLEKEVITFAGDLGVGAFFPSVSPEQLRGIEVNEYAHELAQTTVWIGYIQWLRDNGFGAPSEPILRPLDTIAKMDAILAFDAEGRPVEPRWPDADIIVGNPPFLGGSRLRRELTDEYVEKLWQLYQGRVPAGADFVTYWFEKVRALIQEGTVQRAGLLATNSIRGGANRRVLERIKQTGDIFMAWSDRPWTLDGASVRVSMIGFGNGDESFRTLDGQAVSSINADLTAEANLTQAQPLVENQGIGFRGNQKGGPFDVTETEARKMLSAPLNANGRSNSDVVRRWYNGLDVTRRPRSMWIIDFGINMPIEEAALYELPFEYVKKHVYPIRRENNRRAYADRWWIHAEARPSMRSAIAKLERFIVTPHVSSHRLFVWLEAGIVPDHQLIVIARDDDYFFGVLHSKLHELWSLRMGTFMGVGNDPRYTPTTTFETFPFPWAPGAEPPDDARVQAIAHAARVLVERRDRWLNPDGADAATLRARTLTNLYNERPTWLALAHAALDRAVLDAYGWPHDLPDEEILRRLLALNAERSERWSDRAI
jgi:hypothetical protein